MAGKRLRPHHLKFRKREVTEELGQKVSKFQSKTRAVIADPANFEGFLTQSPPGPRAHRSAANAAAAQGAIGQTHTKVSLVAKG